MHLFTKLDSVRTVVRSVWGKSVTPENRPPNRILSLSRLVVTVVFLFVSGMAVPLAHATPLSEQFQKLMHAGEYDAAEELVDAQMLDDADRQAINPTSLFRALVIEDYDFLLSDDDTKKVYGIISKVGEIDFGPSLSSEILFNLILPRYGAMTAENSKVSMYEAMGLSYDIQGVELYYFLTTLFSDFLNIDELQVMGLAEAERRGLDTNTPDPATAGRLLKAVSQKAVKDRVETVDFLLNDRGMLRYAEFGFEADGKTFNGFFNALGGLRSTYFLSDRALVDIGETQQIWYGYFCDLADRFYHTRLESPKASENASSEEALFTMIGEYRLLPGAAPESCGALVTKMTGDLEDPRALAKRLAEIGDTEGMKWVLDQSAR